MYLADRFEANGVAVLEKSSRCFLFFDKCLC